MDKKKAEVGRKRRHLGKMEKKMGKGFYGILLLGCLLLAIIPSIAYADVYTELKVEISPDPSATDVTSTVPFEIKVVACNGDGQQISPGGTQDNYDLAVRSPFKLSSTDSGALIYDDGQWVSMYDSDYNTKFQDQPWRTFSVVFSSDTFGEGKMIRASGGTGWEWITPDSLSLNVHDFVDSFVIDPPGTQTAGKEFNITIRAIDRSGTLAETFNDDVKIWAVMNPEDYPPPNMKPPLNEPVRGSSFTDGVATIPVIIYGSHPDWRQVKIKCENMKKRGGYYGDRWEMYGGYRAKEYENYVVRVDPNYDTEPKILLLFPGEELRPGIRTLLGKEGSPHIQTAGVPVINNLTGKQGVDVYTTDAYWNPMPVNLPIEFSSNEPGASLPEQTVLGTIDNPETFQVIFYEADTPVTHHWLKVEEVGNENNFSGSTPITVNPNEVKSFVFVTEPPEFVHTTQTFPIAITAYDRKDGNGNVATGLTGWVSLTSSLDHSDHNYIIDMATGERIDMIYFNEGQATANIRITKMWNPVTITVTYVDISETSREIHVSAGNFDRLLVLLQDQLQDAGWGEGRSGILTPVVAGEEVPVKIIACDEYWNSTYNDVGITAISSASNGYIEVVEDLPFSLKSGEAECHVIFRTAKTAWGTTVPQRIMVEGVNNSGESSDIPVKSGPFDRLVLVVPGIPGGGPGEQLDPGRFEEDRKSGSPPTVTAGVPFDLIVAATDYYGNPVDITSEFPDTLRFYANDNHDKVCFAGRKRLLPVDMETPVTTFRDNNILITLAPPTSPQPVRVYGYIDGRYIGYTEVSIPVTHGPLDHYAFSLPDYPLIAGETIADFTITAQDEFNNTYDVLNRPVLLSSNNDVLTGEITVEPRLVIFNDGVATCDLQVFKAGKNVRLRVEYGWWWIVSLESGEFEVIPGPYKKLILRLPGEDLKPGDTTKGVEGKSGNATACSVDNSLQATVYAVDDYWNPTNPTDYNQNQPSIDIYAEEPSHYMQEVVPQTMIEGEITFSLTLKTAATWWGLIAEDENHPEINNSSKINVKPGAFAKLQILAPGENPVPGSPGGKTMGMRPQKAGVDFDLVVRAVDQYWNLVDEESEDYRGETVKIFSKADPGLEDRLPSNGQEFVVTITTFTIHLNWNNGDPVDVTATSVYQPPDVDDDTVYIPVERGYHYDIDTPPDCTAGMTFSMTITLKDDQGIRVQGAKNRVWMRPCLPDAPYPDATNPDGLGRDGGESKPITLDEGQVTVVDQSYDTVEKIRIKVYDEFQREEYSDPIDVRASSLKYEVVVPPEVRAGDKFEMTVKLIDTGTGIVVPSKDGEDKTVNLVALDGEEEAKGHLDVNSGIVLNQGEATITKQYYTKAETIEIKAFDDESWAEESQSASLVVLPGKMAWLQILAPGEEGKWGEWEYQGKGGKYSNDLLPQDIETRFSIKVYAVDQYWNVVDYDGYTVYLTSEPPGGSFDSDPVNLPFKNGKIEDPHFWVTIHQAGSYFTLKAKADDLPPDVDVSYQPVTIEMKGANYEITSTTSSAGTGGSFLLTVELVDSGGRKDEADNQFILTPLTVNYEQAPGKLTITEIIQGTLVEGLPALDGGYAEVKVNYDTAGKIYIKVSDSSGHSPDYTDQLIDIQPEGLKYEVVAPKEVEAGKEFSLIIRLVDDRDAGGAGNLVTLEKYAREVKLDAYYPGPLRERAEGRLGTPSFYLEGGEETISQTYNFAEKIYIVASDGGAHRFPVTSNPPDRSGNIEVIGTPKTVMKLDGVYNEMNGALYLRGNTLVSIECISEIKAKYIYYRDNGGDWKRRVEYVEPFALSPGAHVIEYYGEDKHGHKEEINKSKTIYVSFFGDGVDGVSNRPNPFRAGREETLIEYNLEQPSNVTITIYDLLGQEVWHERYAAGENGGSTANSVSWDGRNLSGKVVANGGYICRIWIQREKKHMVRKIAVAK